MSTRCSNYNLNFPNSINPLSRNLSHLGVCQVLLTTGICFWHRLMRTPCQYLRNTGLRKHPIWYTHRVWWYLQYRDDTVVIRYNCGVKLSDIHGHNIGIQVCATPFEVKFIYLTSDFDHPLWPQFLLYRHTETCENTSIEIMNSPKSFALPNRNRSGTASRFAAKSGKPQHTERSWAWGKLRLETWQINNPEAWERKYFRY